jgi:hypothetical protein
MGSLGRGMFFRPERQRVRELLSRDARPKLVVGGRQFPLFDISMNGLSFLYPDSYPNWTVGDHTDVTLLLHEEEVYSGPARIARIEPSPRKGARIGLGLIGGFLDLPAIRRQDDERRLDQGLQEGPGPLEELVPHEYQDVVMKILHFYQFHRRLLDETEKRYRSEGADESVVRDLTEKAANALRGPYGELQKEASRVAASFFGSRETLLAAKEYTENVLVPVTLCAPLNNRAYNKPLGYPGDYQVMLYYYANAFEGDSVFAKVLHKFAVEHPLSNGVRTRKDLMVEMMDREHQRVIDRDGEDAEFRVANLGCGPAREVSDYIAHRRNWPGRAIWTLIDQEERALSVAYRSSQAQISDNRSAGELFLLNLSFVQLLSEGVPLQEPGTQDFVFSTGLFDYIRETRAQSLIRALYELVADGGMLTIGNACAPQDMFWSAEFLVDWTILYRTRDEVLRLADLLPDTAEVDVVLEPGEAYYFLTVRKP